MAYILDDSQPVRCTLISDQPLFFMDFEDDAEIGADEAEYFDFAALERGLAALEEKIDRLERYSGHSGGEESLEERFALFRDNADALSAPPAIPSETMAELEADLRKSRLAAAFLDFAAVYGTRLVADPQVESALYHRASGQIHVNPHICREDRILLAARELRRAWQHRGGVLLNPLTFQPEQAVLVNRAQIADLGVIMVRIAWELQLAGDKKPWERLETSSMADLCHAFARESYLDFRTLNNGVAQSAVFETWFLSERCRREDRNLIQLMLADYQGYVFEGSGASRQITADLMTALGAMPFGKNYLAPHVAAIMNDAVFTEVRDRSNANFLWFIKFERSFRETEQELQTGCDVTGRDNPCGHINNKNKRFGDNEKATHIIPLSQGGKASPSPEAARAGGGNIVQFRRRTGDA